MKRARKAVGQRGAVAVLVALMLIVLIGAAGIALDLGRLFVAKTELQNAADACALAAARELATPSTLAVLTRAENAGITVGNAHRADFQDDPVVFARDQDVTFSATLTTGYSTKASAPTDSRYVRCTREVPGFMPWFLSLLGATEKTVGATAVAWAQPGNPTCPIPLAMCSKVATPDTCENGAKPDLLTGLCVGKWYGGRFGAGGGINGNFNWVDFSSGGGGSQEVQKGLENCIALEHPIGVGDLVDAKSGVLGASAGTSWNTRFGLYKGGAGNPGPETGAVSDTTGYAYTPKNWTLGRDAFANYDEVREPQNAPYGTTTAQGNADTGLSVSSSYHASTTTEHSRGEKHRRLIAMPTVNCATWGPGHKAEVTGWACALMLTPYQGPTDEIFLEYRGVAGEPGVPCGTFGSPGGTGPLVPTLVQ